MCEALLNKSRVDVKVVKSRRTRHGDFRVFADGSKQITMNQSDNPYRFLITLIHELAHFEVSENYRSRRKPHGEEWMKTFQHMMLPFLTPEIFPSPLLQVLAQHLKRPKASTDSDLQLVIELSKFDLPNNKIYIFDLKEGDRFEVNGRVFVKGKTLRKRAVCTEESNGKRFLFAPQIKVLKC